MAAADFQCRPDAPRAARRRAKLGSALAADCVGEAAAAGASAVFVSATGAAAGGAGLCGVRSAAGSGFGTAVSASRPAARSEEHTSELQSLMRISYAVFCLKKKKKKTLYISRRVSNDNTHNDA